MKRAGVGWMSGDGRVFCLRHRVLRFASPACRRPLTVCPADDVSGGAMPYIRGET